MNTLINIVMYCMWAVTIIAILAATFTNFSYLDLNVLSIVLFFFTLVNTFFCVAAGKKKRSGPPVD